MQLPYIYSKSRQSDTHLVDSDLYSTLTTKEDTYQEDSKKMINSFNQKTQYDQNYCQSSFSDLLPLKISSVTIKKLTWNDFRGDPDPDQKWNAHIFWNISYTYTVDFKQGINKKLKYIIHIQSEINIKYKSWVKKKSHDLLQHEQGHYIIGCLAALEFEKKCENSQFTDNYKNEIPRLFQQTLKEFQKMERKYDKETNHRLDLDKQVQWENFLTNQLLDYQQYFTPKFQKPVIVRINIQNMK